MYMIIEILFEEKSQGHINHRIRVKSMRIIKSMRIRTKSTRAMICTKLSWQEVDFRVWCPGSTFSEFLNYSKNF